MGPELDTTTASIHTSVSGSIRHRYQEHTTGHTWGGSLGFRLQIRGHLVQGTQAGVKRRRQSTVSLENVVDELGAQRRGHHWIVRAFPVRTQNE